MSSRSGLAISVAIWLWLTADTLQLAEPVDETLRTPQLSVGRIRADPGALRRGAAFDPQPEVAVERGVVLQQILRAGMVHDAATLQ